MKIYHLNCVSSHPFGGFRGSKKPSIFKRGYFVNHVLLIEHDNELILVDTGFGINDVENPSRLGKFFTKFLRPHLKKEKTAYWQIKELGFDPTDVRHIILTHLDLDHAGGLDDFPAATVHMMKEEKDFALKQNSWLDRQRYRYTQWSLSQKKWQTYEASKEKWFGFYKSEPLKGISLPIYLIPLPGHTLGHAGVAIKTGESKWLFHAGDAYHYYGQMDSNPHCPRSIATYETFMNKDHDKMLWTQERIRDLKRNLKEDIEVFCSHDPREFYNFLKKADETEIVSPSKPSDFDFLTK